MSRALWFVAGAGAGVYAVARVRRAAEWLTPDGLTDRLAGLSLGIHLFGEEVRDSMADRETELRGRLAVTPQGRPAALTRDSQAARDSDAARDGHPSTTRREGTT